MQTKICKTFEILIYMYYIKKLKLPQTDTNEDISKLHV